MRDNPVTSERRRKLISSLVSLREILLYEIQLVKYRRQQTESQINDSPDDVLFCVICRGKIHENIELFRCSACLTTFHEAHLAIWIQQENRCPICGMTMSGNFVQ